MAKNHCYLHFAIKYTTISWKPEQFSRHTPSLDRMTSCIKITQDGSLIHIFRILLLTFISKRELMSINEIFVRRHSIREQTWCNMQQCLKCVRFVVPHSCDSSKKSLGSRKRHVVCRHSADSTWKIGRIFVKQDRTKMQIFLENFSTNKHFIVDLAYREDLLCSKCGIVPCIFSDLKLHDNTVHSIMRHN